MLCVRRVRMLVVRTVPIARAPITERGIGIRSQRIMVRSQRIGAVCVLKRGQ